MIKIKKNEFINVNTNIPLKYRRKFLLYINYEILFKIVLFLILLFPFRLFPYIYFLDIWINNHRLIDKERFIFEKFAGTSHIWIKKIKKNEYKLDLKTHTYRLLCNNKVELPRGEAFFKVKNNKLDVDYIKLYSNNDSLHELNAKHNDDTSYTYYPNDDGFKLAMLYLQTSDMHHNYVNHIILGHHIPQIFFSCLINNMQDTDLYLALKPQFKDSLEYSRFTNFLGMDGVRELNLSGIGPTTVSFNLLSERIFEPSKKRHLHEFRNDIRIENNGMLGDSYYFYGTFVVKLFKIVKDFYKQIINEIYPDDNDIINDTSLQNMIQDFNNNICFTISNVTTKEALVELILDVVSGIHEHSFSHAASEDSFNNPLRIPFNIKKYQPNIQKKYTDNEIIKNFIIPNSKLYFIQKWSGRSTTSYNQSKWVYNQTLYWGDFPSNYKYIKYVDSYKEELEKLDTELKNHQFYNKFSKPKWNIHSSNY